jgi:hypothetical protein
VKAIGKVAPEEIEGEGKEEDERMGDLRFGILDGM